MNISGEALPRKMPFYGNRLRGRCRTSGAVPRRKGKPRFGYAEKENIIPFSGRIREAGRKEDSGRVDMISGSESVVASAAVVAIAVSIASAFAVCAVCRGVILVVP
jgi:hypothetical protein